MKYSTVQDLVNFDHKIKNLLINTGKLGGKKWIKNAISWINKSWIFFFVFPYDSFKNTEINYIFLKFKLLELPYSECRRNIWMKHFKIVVSKIWSCRVADCVVLQWTCQWRRRRAPCWRTWWTVWRVWTASTWRPCPYTTPTPSVPSSSQRAQVTELSGLQTCQSAVAIAIAQLLPRKILLLFCFCFNWTLNWSQVTKWLNLTSRLIVDPT